MTLEIGTRVRVNAPGWGIARVVESAADRFASNPDLYSAVRGDGLEPYWVLQPDDGQPEMWLHEMYLTPIED